MDNGAVSPVVCVWKFRLCKRRRARHKLEADPVYRAATLRRARERYYRLRTDPAKAEALRQRDRKRYARQREVILRRLRQKRRRLREQRQQEEALMRVRGASLEALRAVSPRPTVLGLVMSDEVKRGRIYLGQDGLYRIRPDAFSSAVLAGFLQLDVPAAMNGDGR